MGKEHAPILILLLLTFFAACFGFFQVDGSLSESYPVHNIDTGRDYTTIQEAINANETQDGHTIQVDAGTHSGSFGYPIVVNKSISLQGESRDNTTILGQPSYEAIYVTVTNVTIKGFRIQDGASGIRTHTYTHITSCVLTNNTWGISPSLAAPLIGSNLIEDNLITDNGVGISTRTNNSRIFHNTITDNHCGIGLEETEVGLSGGIFIYENIIENNQIGFAVAGSANNTIFHNNVVHNQAHLFAPYSRASNWDNGFEGNYWSDYSGSDNNSNGIGDIPYVVNGSTGNVDRFPLMGRFQIFNVSVWGQGQTRFEEVYAVSNSMIGSVELASWLSAENEYFKPGQNFIWLRNITEEGATGFCRLMTPNNLLNTSDYVVVNSDMNVLAVAKLPASNTTHTYLYFSYVNPTQELYVTIPELPSFLFPLLITVAASTLTTLVYKTKTKE